LQFIGLYFNPYRAGGMFIVSESMRLGSLEHFLRTYYTKDSGPLPHKYLLMIALDIARGLQVLHDEIKIAHCDLRSENIYLDEGLQAKIGGFGMTIYSCKTAPSAAGESDGSPYAAYPPENGEGNDPGNLTKDIYAFGFILKELWNKGAHKKAYSGMTGFETFEAITSGKQEAIPENCPVEIANLMLNCWRYDPTKRPKASALVSFFKEQLEKYPLAEKYRYYITPPTLYLNRSTGSKVGYRSTEYSSDKETLLHYLDVTHLASPQHSFFVKGTQYAKHLLIEFEVLMDEGLDTSGNFDFIRKHLAQYANHDTPVIANLLNVLNKAGLFSGTHQYQHANAILQLPEQRTLIQTVLEHLSTHAISLCTDENVDFIIEQRAFLKTACLIIQGKTELTQADLTAAFTPSLAITSGEDVFPLAITSGEVVFPLAITSGEDVPPLAITSGEEVPPLAITSGEDVPPLAITSGEEVLPLTMVASGVGDIEEKKSEVSQRKRDLLAVTKNLTQTRGTVFKSSVTKTDTITSEVLTEKLLFMPYK